MAAATLTPIKVNINEFLSTDLSALTFTAVDSTDGATLVLDGKDTNYLVLVQNANESTAKSVTIKAGNGIQGVADLTYSIAATKYQAIRLESGRFKNVTGTLKGKVKFTGASTDIKLLVFQLV